MVDDDQNAILFGGDYNPEQWPEDTWQGDIDKLKQANINVATINVFSWALLEPRENVFNFEQLDRIIALLVRNKIKIILATSTAAIPAWIIQKYPGIARVDVNGIRQKQGKRHNACPNSPDFKRLARGLVKRLVERYKDCPELTYWHVSNEYEGYCYCDNCAVAFREWLQQKYGTLERLNLDWNSNIWSHTYHEWSEIEPPMMTTDLFDNGKPVLSGAAIDYQRFQSDSLLNDFKLERDVIKQFDQQHPVTTNLMGSQKALDYFKWAPEMDIISWDSYPMPDDSAAETAMEHDLMRGLKQQPFLLMEETPNQQNWYPYNALKKPGEMRMLSYQAIAHGANNIAFFQLKQSRSGAEKFHGSVLTHSDSVHTRTFKEVQQLGKEVTKLPMTLNQANVQANVAVIFDWDSYWGLENSIGPLAKLSYVKEVQRFYQMLYGHGLTVDLVAKDADLMKYQLVVAPVLYMMNPQAITNITRYVEQGGTFLTTYMSGIADQTDNIYIGGYPGPLREILGLHIDEHDARSAKQSVRILAMNQSEVGTADGVCDLIIPDTATTLAHYSNDVFYNNYATITRNHYGRGTAYYCGAELSESGLNYLMEKLANTAGLKLGTSPKVEVTTRATAEEKFIFIINTDNREQTIMNPVPLATSLLTGKESATKLVLGPYAVEILHQIL
ncbi:beta-galactosidase [Levilactobacillus parabrevis]|uniref:beta-galactosidase n=1 Tax=Levilactobacillus parabrevis TaxID=357278 RepID=UPI0021A71907|nr:beta-galactosidase [Levilactobacillus parabrevis]MCT4486779.1 beta-galactosidase [Levilactobacillus parabrevis]MCT4491159.1 beta-galactosidase [Levilactobacillus parabrevis]